mgnify:CR=1 FL=1
MAFHELENVVDVPVEFLSKLTLKMKQRTLPSLDLYFWPCHKLFSFYSRVEHDRMIVTYSKSAPGGGTEITIITPVIKPTKWAEGASFHFYNNYC